MASDELHSDSLERAPFERDLSRRERQIMEVLHGRGPSTVAEVLERLPEPPGYSAVRALLRTMEEKGHVHHLQDGPRYVYQTKAPKESARTSAVHHLVRTFFDGSTTEAVAALLGSDRRLDPASLDRILEMIEQARREGR